MSEDLNQIYCEMSLDINTNLYCPTLGSTSSIILPISSSSKIPQTIPWWSRALVVMCIKSQKFNSELQYLQFSNKNVWIIIRDMRKVWTIIGALNWGLVGLLNFDLVAAIFGKKSIVSRLVYTLVGLAGVYLIINKAKWAMKKHGQTEGKHHYPAFGR